MKEVSAKKLSLRKKKLRNSTEKAENNENPYELVEFVVRHFRIQYWKEYSGVKYSAQELVGFLNDFIELVRSDRTVGYISPPVTIVGDLNGHFQDLIRIFNIKNEKTKKEDDWKQVFASEKFVFLGNFTGDNQQFNLETVCLLFGLKMIYANRYILLRGSEETKVSSELQKQIMTKFPGSVGEEIWQKFKMAFCMLPAAAVVGDKIFCVHGGISPEIKKSIDEWKKVPKTDKFENLSPVIRDLIFARPCEPDEEGAGAKEAVYMFHDKTNARYFNEAAVRYFCALTKIELIVGSHYPVVNGFRFFADKKLVTIFSSTAYMKQSRGAFLRVSKEGVVSIIQMRPTEKKKEEKQPKKKSGEGTTKIESAEKVKKSQETPKKGSKDPVNNSKEDEKSKEKTEDGATKKKKVTSKPKSKELESIYDNLSEKN